MQDPEQVTFEVGELKAKELCVVTVTYLEQLKTLKNKFWRFRFRDKMMPCIWAQDYHLFSTEEPPDVFFKKVHEKR